MKKKQSAMSQQEEVPWYLEERPRLLASLLFAKGENVRVDDVSSLDLGLDLVVRPAKKTEDGEANWIFGVVTKGVMSLPEQAEVVENGILLPRSEMEGIRIPDVDYPVLFAYCTMQDDAAYVGLFADPDAPLRESGGEFLKQSPTVGYVDRTGQPVPLTEVKNLNRNRVLEFLQAFARDVAQDSSTQDSDPQPAKPQEVPTRLFSSRWQG